MSRPIVFAIFALCCSLHAQDDGMPFGPIKDADIDKLSEFARKCGFDLIGEMDRAYKNDEVARGRVFKFSLVFKTLDANARIDGQIVYSSLLNLGEGM
jgi:hypothetical protein